ncbi:MAG: hypothetical protein HN348_33920 [Proteobacteria bacterium]|nr:hypothetical protein [Pseudomonadota bacterium]
MCSYIDNADNDGTNHTGDLDRIQFTPDVSGLWAVVLDWSSATDNNVWLFDESMNALNGSTASSLDGPEWFTHELVGGTSYYVVIGGWEGEKSFWRLEIENLDDCDTSVVESGDTSGEVEDVGAVSDGTKVCGNTYDAANDLDYVSFTPDTTGYWEASLIWWAGGDYDLFVTYADGTEIVGAASFSYAPPERAMALLLAGETYHFIVDAYSGNASDWQVQFRYLQPPPCANPLTEGNWDIGILPTEGTFCGDLFDASNDGSSYTGDTDTIAFEVAAAGDWKFSLYWFKDDLDYDLYLYDDQSELGTSAGIDMPEEFTVTLESSHTYYIDVAGWDGGGPAWWVVSYDGP